MSFPTFSIITPVYVHNQERKKQLFRAIDIVANQTYLWHEEEKKFEHIIIDDGSRVDISEEMKEICERYPWIVFWRKDKHEERAITYNQAFEKATKDWFCFLDSDDMYSPYYLETVAEMISWEPKYKMFNFGSVHFHCDYRVTCRGPFTPKKLEKGHEVFGGGTIVNGTFVFHRECYEKLGGFPHFTNPWDFSTTAQEEYPELKQFFVVSHPDHKEGYPKELGNPWGNDFYIFYKMTREYHSKPIGAFLYMVFHKGQKGLRKAQFY